ncbi:MAG: hypothetical protein JW809_19525 [Pirellulales bacterium]|nr:hypothetical protein [Pirellulales bacterium]
MTDIETFLADLDGELRPWCRFCITEYEPGARFEGDDPDTWDVHVDGWGKVDGYCGTLYRRAPAGSRCSGPVLYQNCMAVPDATLEPTKTQSNDTEVNHGEPIQCGT